LLNTNNKLANNNISLVLGVTKIHFWLIFGIFIISTYSTTNAAKMTGM